MKISTSYIMNKIEKAPAALAQQKSMRVYTKLKFVKSEVSGAPVSFVSQNPKTGRICGCVKTLRTLRKSASSIKCFPVR